MTRSKEQPRIGRPPIAEESRRTTHIKVLATEAERAELEQAAEAAGLGVSTWMRVVALEKARRNIGGV